MTKNKQINIRVNACDLADWRWSAENAKLSLSAFITIACNNFSKYCDKKNNCTLQNILSKGNSIINNNKIKNK